MDDKKITVTFKTQWSKTVWEAILKAKEEVDKWPAWKRGEAPVPPSYPNGHNDEEE